MRRNSRQFQRSVRRFFGRDDRKWELGIYEAGGMPVRRLFRVAC